MPALAVDGGPVRKPNTALPPGVTQEMIDASLAANPQASTGAYMGPPMATDMAAAAQAATQAATPTTQGSPIPGVDPFRLAQASDAYNRALASVNARRGSTLTSYGFKASGYDDSGNATGLEVDPNSTYGQYQQMLDSQARASMGAENDAAGRGFSGGLANQAESGLKYQQGGQRLNLGGALLGDLGSLNTELLGAKKGYDDELYNARLDAARAAADAGNFTQIPSAPYTDPGSNPAAGPGTVPYKPTTTTAPTAAARAATLAQKVVARTVTANKTGATYSRARGVISIH